MVVRLETAHCVMLDPSSTGLLSFHCWEQEVFAALPVKSHTGPGTMDRTNVPPPQCPHSSYKLTLLSPAMD
ncbi:hypothetical protein TIFTF001_024903 [Ficus carica]|uniref:Uncharacterized protein n=1 Tax=Ficus carica TaxID=3494 RepID=A0AA88AW79_FICCA|nr:hypothetical protein TIFTF001_024903 [Ficus carica]